MPNLKKDFITGLIVFLPLTLTIYLLILTINFADGLLGRFLAPHIIKFFGFYVYGLSILVAVVFILIIGFFANNFFGRRLYNVFERMLLKLPFFRQVYPAIKEMALFLFSRDKLAFNQVVLIEYPRKGIFAIGFLTNESSATIRKLTRQELCNVFVPSAPGPLTGYVMLVPKKDIITTNINVEDAIKLIVSGGVVNPATDAEKN